MILIIGGAFQGKLEYAKKTFLLNDTDIADGKNCDLDKIKNYKAVAGFHNVIRRVIQNGNDPHIEINKLIENGNLELIISDEIGSGIIPIEREDRFLRESVGKILSVIAAKSETVIRVTCSIPMIIKSGGRL